MNTPPPDRVPWKFGCQLLVLVTLLSFLAGVLVGSTFRVRYRLVWPVEAVPAEGGSSRGPAR